jgi:hypothetical protein
VTSFYQNFYILASQLYSRFGSPQRLAALASQLYSRFGSPAALRCPGLTTLLQVRLTRSASLPWPYNSTPGSAPPQPLAALASQLYSRFGSPAALAALASQLYSRFSSPTVPRCPSLTTLLQVRLTRSASLPWPHNSTPGSAHRHRLATLASPLPWPHNSTPGSAHPQRLAALASHHYSRIGSPAASHEIGSLAAFHSSLPAPIQDRLNRSFPRDWLTRSFPRDQLTPGFPQLASRIGSTAASHEIGSPAASHQIGSHAASHSSLPGLPASKIPCFQDSTLSVSPPYFCFFFFCILCAVVCSVVPI